MGTRGSALALAQSGLMARALEKLTPGLSVETVVIKTSGDRFSAGAPDAPVAPQGGAKGLFVKEIEEALLDGKIDFAVHSSKDLPARLADGLVIGAYPEREDPRDAFVGKDGLALKKLPKGARVATASLRRQAQLKLARPDLQTIPMRGNVDTRLRKLSEGVCEGLLLAAAGLRRLGKAGEVKHELVPVDVMLPSPAQGALALEAREGDAAVIGKLAALDHAATRLAVEFERALLAALGGDCATPFGALATPEGKGVTMSAFLCEEDGSRPRRLKRRCDDVKRRDDFAADCAAELRKG